MSRLTVQPIANISLTIALFEHLKFVDTVRYARALQASFAVDPTGALVRLHQGVPLYRLRMSREWAVTIDEGVPVAHLT